MSIVSSDPLCYAQPTANETFGDDQLYAALDKAVLYASTLPPGSNMTDYLKAMAHFDTGFYQNICYTYTGNIGNMGGTWSGYEVNYIGVGEVLRPGATRLAR